MCYEDDYFESRMSKVELDAKVNSQILDYYEVKLERLQAQINQLKEKICPDKLEEIEKNYKWTSHDITREVE